MTAAFLTGLAMIGLALVMFVVAIPREGEMIGFPRYRAALETAYTMLLALLLIVGSAGVIAEWGGRWGKSSAGKRERLPEEA